MEKIIDREMAAKVYIAMIEDIKKHNPKSQWNIKIKKAMALKAKEEKEANVNLTDPMGINVDKTSEFDSIAAIRTEAAKIVSAGDVIVQFVRPGKRQLSKVAVDMKNGKVHKKFKRNQPIGALVVFTAADNVLVGWSKYNKTAEVLPFSKKAAVETAVMRGLADRIYPNGRSEYTTAEDVRLPAVIAKALPSFLERVEKIFDKKADNVGVFIGNA
jgi:hypothetical protein